jgi:hypothetical protein
LFFLPGKTSRILETALRAGSPQLRQTSRSKYCA